MNRILAVSFVSVLVLGCGAAARGPLAPRDPHSPVIVYTAQNCGDGCWAMLNHLRSRGVAHLERDVDRMPGAREEVMAKLDDAGLEASAPPVLDFRGTIVVGYQSMSIDQLCDADHQAQSSSRGHTASR